MNMQKSKDRIIPTLIVSLALSLGLAACGSGSTAVAADCAWAQHPSDIANLVAVSHFAAAPPTCITRASTGTYTATFQMTKGTITVTLDQQLAPVSVNNFVFLATHHFYDNVLFHRVVPNFIAQGGDPNSIVPGVALTSLGSGGPGYTIANEFPKTSTVFTQGCLAMANSGPGTTGSQFFFCTADDSQKLAPYYNYFGKVTVGMDLLSQIAQGDAIQSITISHS